MAFGTREPFTYVECASCGCVQIGEVPENLGDYYPSGYFAYRDYRRLAKSRFRALVDRRRYAHATGNFNLIGWLANRVSNPLPYVEWVRAAGTDRSARVLDIGCGSGKLLVRMKLAGFRECVGVDPFIGHSIHYPNGVSVHHADLESYAAERPGPFDLVMLHHALEHMPEQHRVMRAVKELLGPRGCVLVRIPVADSYAWRHYRENWVNLDPPRHLYLHTRRSMELLAEQAGLAVGEVVHDSTARQFLGSELCTRNIALNETNPERVAIERRRADYERRAGELNRQGDGDMAAFYLFPTERAASAE